MSDLASGTASQRDADLRLLCRTCAGVASASMATTTVSRGSAAGERPRAKRKAPFPVEFYRSGLGKKYVMAITGIMLMGFVFAHMVGNLKMFLGPEEFNHYGEFLRELLVPIVPRTVALWGLRLGLIAAFALHIHSAYSLTIWKKREYSGLSSRTFFLTASKPMPRRSAISLQCMPSS